MYRIHQIILRLGEDKNLIPSRIAKKTKKSEKAIKGCEIVRESVDARDKNDIKMVYTVDFLCEGKVNVREAPDMTYRPISPKGALPDKRPVITGSGPCGLFAALILSEAGFAPLVIERGRSVEDRVRDVKAFKEKGILDEESNVQFGEGGAGTFSDGKLYTGTRDKRIRKVLETFYEAGADPEILYRQKPHIGTDRLRKIIPKIRSRIIKNGGEIRFSSKLTEICTENGKLKSVFVNNEEEIHTDDLILAQGQSAYDTISMLHEKGIFMEQKAFSIGIRIRHEQRMIDEAQWGSTENTILLGPAEYKLSKKCTNKRGVYTFCMCPGGEVIPAASSKGYTVINGMSNSARDGKYANCGLLVDVKKSDFGSAHPLAGFDFRGKYEKIAFETTGKCHMPPQSTYGDFALSEEDPVSRCIPRFARDSIIEAMPYFGRKIKGFDGKDSLLKAVETRSSSPVRLIRNEKMMSNIEGIYPAGEGAGHAGGIISAAVDGIKTAESIIRRYIENE